MFFSSLGNSNQGGYRNKSEVKPWKTILQWLLAWLSLTEAFFPGISLDLTEAFSSWHQLKLPIPCGPAGPSGPSAPLGPSSPVKPSDPLSPGSPLLPLAPWKPSFPDIPLFPGGPGDPVSPGGPIGPVCPGSPLGPTEPFLPRSPFGPGREVFAFTFEKREQK